MHSSERNLSTREWCGIDSATLLEFLDHVRRAQERNGSSRIVLREDIRRVWRRFVMAHPQNERKQLRQTLGQRIDQTEEMIFHGPAACIVLREEPGRRRAYLVGSNGKGSANHLDPIGLQSLLGEFESAQPSPNGDEGSEIRLLNERQFLSLRESMVLGRPVPERFSFGIDFSPFRISPTEAGSLADIGTGPMRVAQKLQEAVHTDPQFALTRVLEFIARREANGGPLFFMEPPRDVQILRRQLVKAIDLLASRPDHEDLERVLPDLELLGFTRGWGDQVGRALVTLSLLSKLILDPTPEDFQELFQRLPLVRRVLLVSVHGWFAQRDVLGRPDTGGQVVYVLDQARAIENYLRAQWREAGVELDPEILILTRLIPEADGSSCNRRREKVEGTRCSWILRVPFEDPSGEVLPQWISRFQVWPYLGRFARRAYGEVMDELAGQAPDLVVGHYSDGNTVASLLGREWSVPIAVTAHALEKTKYLMSDLYWRDQESDYHFSLQYLSDILATNSADIIITSSYQEIAGTRTELGQYESYEVFTLPERYRVFSGINLHSARFVINPPGVDTDAFAPHAPDDDKAPDVQALIEGYVFGEQSEELGIRGRFADPGKPIIFTAARLDRIKNLSGLLRTYARRERLRESANLLILSGVTSLAESKDHEEREQIQKILKLLEQPELAGKVRWIPSRYSHPNMPYYYRIVAKSRGIFVQPALFEAFGLTVLEAMATGLPVVATQFGGPASIIEDGVNGFLVDPNRASEMEKAILTLITGPRQRSDDLWSQISHAAIRRVHEHFSWPGHARRLSVSYGLFGLWNHFQPSRRQVRRTYVDALYHLLFQRLVAESWPHLVDDFAGSRGEG